MEVVGVEIGDAEMDGKGRNRQTVVFLGLSAIGPWGIFLRHTDNEDGDCEPITAGAECSMADPGPGEDSKRRGGRGGKGKEWKGVGWEKRERREIKGDLRLGVHLSRSSIDY